MAATARTLREGSFSVASMATGNSITSPALASILSGEESAISGAAAEATVPSLRVCIVPCPHRATKIVVGMRAPPITAAVSALKGRPRRVSAVGAGLDGGSSNPASSLCSRWNSCAARSAISERARARDLPACRNLWSGSWSCDDGMTSPDWLRFRPSLTFVEAGQGPISLGDR